MKNKILMALAAVSCIALNTPASAQENPAGYNETAVTIVTVEQAKGMNDDMNVILRGNLQQANGDDMYIFTDGTGSINVEIDEDVWNNVQVTPEDLIQINGEIDRSGNVIEIDVNQISKITNK